MKQKQCPNCDLVNPADAEHCARCGLKLEDEKEFAIGAKGAIRESDAPFAEGVPQDNDLGKRLVFWFRVYCGATAILSLPVIGMGLILITMAGTFESQDPQGDMAAGLILGLGGTALVILYTLGIFIRRRPLGWYFGLILIVLGLLTCILLPATIPLLIFWLKPDSKLYFGRY